MAWEDRVRPGAFLIVVLGFALILAICMAALLRDARSGNSRRQGGDIWRYLG